MPPVLLVALGGALGSVARYLLVVTVQQRFGTGFPYGTIAVNVLGSMLIAVVYELAGASRIAPDLRLFLATGIMGGFTTYSAFNHETLGFLSTGAWGVALLNLAITVAGCLLGGWAGVAIARWWI